MVTQKIKSLKDQTLDTNVDHKLMTIGEVTVVKFLNQAQIMSFVSMGVLELVPDTEPIRKVIPVIGTRPMVDDAVKREVEVQLVFSPEFQLEDHMRNGV